ncbi:hypothetical protein ACEPAI_3350 [Sanghuangporus weigelae]
MNETQHRKGPVKSINRLFPQTAIIRPGTDDSYRNRKKAPVLGVLTPHTQTPEVSQPPVRTDLLQALQVVTKLRVDVVRKDLIVLPIDNILLPVEEPRGDLVLRRILDDGDDALEFV